MSGEHKEKKVKTWRDDDMSTLGLRGSQLQSTLTSMNVAIASTPTFEMRAELESAGVALPAEEELNVLSTQFNEWLTAAFYELGGKVESLSWKDLYNVMDDDASGFLTFDEVRTSIFLTALVLTVSALTSVRLCPAIPCGAHEM